MPKKSYILHRDFIELILSSRVWSMADLARKADVDEKTLTNVIVKQKPASPPIVRQIAEALNMPAVVLLKRESTPLLNDRLIDLSWHVVVKGDFTLEQVRNFLDDFARTLRLEKSDIVYQDHRAGSLVIDVLMTLRALGKLFHEFDRREIDTHMPFHSYVHNRAPSYGEDAAVLSGLFFHRRLRHVPIQHAIIPDGTIAQNCYCAVELYPELQTVTGRSSGLFGLFLRSSLNEPFVVRSFT